MSLKRTLLILILCAIALSLGVVAFMAIKRSLADPADFYKGKKVTYIVATAPGGGYDAYGRLVAEYMQKYLPGSTFVVENIPDVRYIAGANAIYAAKPDGLTIGTFNTGLIYTQLTEEKGVQYDLTKMSWVGKAASEPRVFFISATSPINSFSDLQTSSEPVNFATFGVGGASYVETKILIDTLKLPVKILDGYTSAEGIMAMRRGEVVGIIGSRSSFEEHVKNASGKFIAQIGGKNADVPQLSTLVTEENAKALVALIQSQGELSRLTAGPPNIPIERLEVLRTAYKKALEDPKLQARAEKLGRPVDPGYGDEVLKQVKSALNQSPDTIALLSKTLAAKPATPANGAPSALVKVDGPLLEVEEQGRLIAFNGPDGQKVQAKPSGSRTKIKIAGKDTERGDLKVGLICEINYKPGGENEPSTIECK